MLKPRPKKTGKHVVGDYRAREDWVMCTCGFSGTVEEYNVHRISENSQLTKAVYRRGGEWA